MSGERDLIDAFARVADGFQRDAVISAAANMLLNALRQEHATVGAAEEQLAEIAARMKTALRERHYDENGARRVQRIIIPRELVN